MHTRSFLFPALGVSSALLAGTAWSSGTSSGPSSASPSTSGTPVHSQAPAEAGLAWGDIDGDGKDDAFVVGAEGQARLLMNFGEGRFEDVTLAANLAELGGATCALFADLDGDGRLDLFVGSSEHRLWKNIGNATFEPMPSGIEHDLVDLAAQAVDRDQDGRLDLQIHTEAGDLVYRNLGEGRFERLALPLGDLPQAPSHVGWSAPDSVDATDPLAPPDAGTPAQRRLGRWAQGRAVGGFASATASGSALAGPSLPFLASCQPGVRDANGGACIGASSVPELGKLLPLNDKFYIDPTTRHVSIGGTSPFQPLTVIAHGDGFTQFSTLDNTVVGSYVGGGIGWYGTYTNHPLGFFVNYGAQPSLLIDTAGKVGIGTTSPTDKLHVAGSSDGDLRIDHWLKFGLNTGIDATSENGDAIHLYRFNGGPNVSNLYLHLGDAPAGSLTDAFIIQAGANDRFQFYSGGTAAKPGGGSWAVLSDRRAKRDIAPLADSLEKLLELRGVSFSYKDPTAPGAGPGQFMGMIAQEVEEVFPEWVRTGPDGTKMLSISGFEALSVEAFREQQQEIDALHRESEEQRDEIASLQGRVAELESLQSEIQTLKTSLAALAAR